MTRKTKRNQRRPLMAKEVAALQKLATAFKALCDAGLTDRSMSFITRADCPTHDFNNDVIAADLRSTGAATATLQLIQADARH